MTPAESMLATTLQVSDPEIRNEMEDIIRAVVHEELRALTASPVGTIPTIANGLYANRSVVEQLALQAIKRFWRDNTPGVYT